MARTSDNSASRVNCQYRLCNHISICGMMARIATHHFLRKSWKWNNHLFLSKAYPCQNCMNFFQVATPSAVPRVKMLLPNHCRLLRKMIRNRRALSRLDQATLARLPLWPINTIHIPPVRLHHRDRSLLIHLCLRVRTCLVVRLVRLKLAHSKIAAVMVRLLTLRTAAIIMSSITLLPANLFLTSQEPLKILLDHLGHLPPVYLAAPGMDHQAWTPFPATVKLLIPGKTTYWVVTTELKTTVGLSQFILITSNQICKFAWLQWRNRYYLLFYYYVFTN